jgi:hypothetical protein
MQKTLQVLFVMAMCSPATAQESFATGSAINDQNARVTEMRDLWYNTCLKPQFEENPLPIIDWPEALIDQCRAIKDFYLFEVNTLVRLIHGETPIVCSDNNCPEQTN